MTETRLVETRGCARNSDNVDKSDILEVRLFGRVGCSVEERAVRRKQKCDRNNISEEEGGGDKMRGKECNVTQSIQM